MSHVSKIIFPNKPHLDPIAAYWVLLHYGQERFPGVQQASLSVWKAGAAPDRDTLRQWQHDNVISFDIEGGTFDHHGTTMCTTLLVAQHLGVAESPELQTLLRYIQEDDAAGLHNNFGDLAGVLKALYKHGDSTEDVIKITLKILDALQSKEVGWLVGAKKEFDDKAKIFKIKRGKNKIKLAVIQSDNPDVANYAKQEQGIAIAVQKNSRGHVFIFTNAMYRLNLKSIVAVIRLRELELNNKKLRNAAELKKPGKIIDVQNWFYHDSLNAIMNGSAALSETPPTKISLEEIVGIIVFGLSSDTETVPDNAAEQQQYLHFQELFNRVGR